MTIDRHKLGPWAIVTGDGTSGSSLIEAYLSLSAVAGATVAPAFEEAMRLEDFEGNAAP